jgi:hypothetical protein
VPLRDKIIDMLGMDLSTRLMNNTKIGVTPIFRLSGLLSYQLPLFPDSGNGFFPASVIQQKGKSREFL